MTAVYLLFPLDDCAELHGGRERGQRHPRVLRQVGHAPAGKEGGRGSTAGGAEQSLNVEKVVSEGNRSS